MILKISQAKLLTHPDAEKLSERLQSEYDKLIIKLNDFYYVKKTLLLAKKEQLLSDVEHSELIKQYNELKEKFNSQKRDWKMLTQQLA